MPNIEVTNQAPTDISLSSDMYHEAAKRHITFSQLLENVNPTQAGQKLDAFERQLLRYDIRLKDDTVNGIRASVVGDFFANREMNFGGLQTDRPSTSTSAKILFPEWINRVAREAKMAQYGVADLVALDRGIDSDTYRATTITITPADVRRGRVTEKGSFPIAAIATSQTGNILKKYGIQFEATYEVLRRMSLPLVERMIAGSLLVNKNDQFATCLDTIINGDGNASTAATAYSLTVLDTAASAGTLTYKGWLAFLAKAYPYKFNVVVGNINALLQVILMTKPTVDPIQLMTTMDLARAGGTINFTNTPWGNISFVLYESTDIDNQLIAIDKGFAVERLHEVGADLTETERIIAQQFERIVVSDVEGYSCIFQAAKGVLNYNS